MPGLQLLVSELNGIYNSRPGIEALRTDRALLEQAAELCRPPATLESMMKGWLRNEIALRRDCAPEEVADEELDDNIRLRVLRSIPSALRAALQAVILENFDRALRDDGPVVPITFAWVPGYDYGIQVWDITDSATTMGGITCIITTRYPDDPHPLTGEAAL